jgi:acetyl esterase/lipase
MTLFVVLAMGHVATANEPTVISLWNGKAPGAIGDQPKDRPQLTIYLADSKLANSTAVVICPGGGYGGLASSYEGHDVARWFNTFGVAGCVLDYRHRGKGYGHPAPLHDAQRAIRLVRARAGEWKLNPQRIGVLGFSAGGHLASTVATHFDEGVTDAEDPIDRVSCRPDFAILCYAVIAFGRPYSHIGSQNNLLGKDADQMLVASLSNERQVNEHTPPTFLWTTDADRVVTAENSVMFYLALRKANIPAELHIFEQGRHGLGLAETKPGAQHWPTLCKAWLQVR